MSKYLKTQICILLYTMLELIINPKKSDGHPWELFFVGLLWATVAILLVSFIFAKDTVLSQYGGILVVTFTVIASLPYMYFVIKNEENKDVQITKTGKLLKEHSKAIFALMWLFAGFVIAFSFWYLMLPQFVAVNFNAQLQVFCAINSPSNYQECINQYGVSFITGDATKPGIVMSIFANNISVLIFTILFSLIFGAGAIFILAWNASVIAAAIGIFAKGNILRLPLGILRYIVHGLPEISSYFIGALAGGIISVAIIRKDLKGERMWRILQDALVLVIIAVVILLISAILEVFVTPLLFG